MLGAAAAYAFCNLVLIHNWGTAFEMVVGLALMKYFQSVHPRSNNLGCIHCPELKLIKYSPSINTITQKTHTNAHTQKYPTPHPSPSPK